VQNKKSGTLLNQHLTGFLIFRVSLKTAIIEKTCTKCAHKLTSYFVFRMTGQPDKKIICVINVAGNCKQNMVNGH
jgi:hypothetical protein